MASRRDSTCGKNGIGKETKLCTNFLPDFHWSLVLVLFVLVEMSASVPTQDLRVRQGQEEVVAMSARSLYWPQPLGSYYNSDGGMRQDKRTSQPMQICGHRLLETMRGLCRGNYVAYSRRSDPDIQELRQVDDSQRRGGFKGSESLHGRFRRNIISECCLKPCSVNEMLRYCGR